MNTKYFQMKLSCKNVKLLNIIFIKKIGYTLIHIPIENWEVF